MVLALDPGKPGDAAPGQGRHQGHRLVARDCALAGEPPPGAGLGQAGQPGGQQQGPLRVGAGVGGDDLGDRLHADPGAAVDDRADVVVIAQITLEDQAEGLTLGVDEVEVGADGGVHAGAVVVRRAHRLGDPVGEFGDVLLEQRQVELPLTREVLVEDRLAHPGPVGDVIHGRRVEALRHEDVLRSPQQLQPTGAPRQAGGAAAGYGGGALAVAPGGSLPVSWHSACPEQGWITVERVSEVVLSGTPLPPLKPVLPPWPGEQWPVRGGKVFVRSTPWTGPVDRPDGSPDPVEAPRERALYVHGLGGASTNWTDLAALLAVRFHGWALDLPGFGRSQPPPRGRYSIRGHVRAVVDVLERIVEQPGPGAGRPVHLLGNSLGGLVSLLVASRRPDLVASLTLISPAMPVYRVPEAFSRLLLP